MRGWVMLLAWVVGVGLVPSVRAQAPASQAPAAASQVETGEINGAAFRIEIPADWTRGLIVYAHGYTRVGSGPANPESPFARSVRGIFLSRGFAFIESSYSAQGWAVKEGIEDTEALRRYFVKKHGRPSESYIVGHSMGGHITVATIERYPDAYDGALPLCGPLGAAVEFMNTGIFDMLVTFEALFPGTIGSPYEPTPATATKVKDALAADPVKAEIYARHFARGVEQLPGVLAFWHEIARELKARAGGEPFDNRNRIYAGFGDDVALNRAVKRYTADPAALEYLRLYASPEGRTSDPVLTVHTTSDELVLGKDVTAYETLAARAGTSDRFVARFVEAKGHCNISPPRIATAFDALRTWAKEGKRPAPGEQP